MAKFYRCPTCGEKVTVLTVWFSIVQIECSTHGVMEIEAEKKEGQQSLFGYGAIQLFILIFIYILTVSSLMVAYTPRCPAETPSLILVCKTIGR